MSGTILKVMGTGALVVALALPLGACSDDTVSTAEKRVEAEKTALETEKAQVAQNIEQKQEALQKEEERLKAEVAAKKDRAEQAIESKLDDLDKTREQAEKSFAARKEQLMHEFDARKAELDKRLDQVADKSAAEKEKVEKEIADGKAALDEELKRREAQLDADRQNLIQRAERDYDQIRSGNESISEAASETAKAPAPGQASPGVQKTSVTK